MPRMRASKGVSKEIWTLPYLLQAIRIRGQASWSCKVELVAGCWHRVTGFLQDEKSNWMTCMEIIRNMRPKTGYQVQAARSKQQDTR